MERLIVQNVKNHNNQASEIRIIVQLLDRVSDSVLSLQNMQSSTVSKSDLETCYQKLQEASVKGKESSASTSILNSLCFKSMNVRHSQITEAHRATFDWILDPPELPANDPRYHIKFKQWLQSGTGIYWISGKPGSGKSTLMKYLYDQERTKTLLREWSKTTTLVLAGHFFWNSGTYMQKSQQGLLQSLLYEILAQHPDIVRAVSPNKWSAALSDPQTTHEWTLSDLFQAFSNLVSQEMCRAHFCFFIDGLDEYDGDHFDIIEAIELLASSQNVKICVSSRPWNVFENAFGRHLWKKLYLQELTRTDIEKYVQNKLTDHAAFAMYSLEDPKANELVQEVVDKAQGVFLWVFLACRDLKQGLTNEDPIEVLQARLRRMPSELEPFFTHMLEKIDEIYLEKMSCFFQIALISSGPLPVLVYSFIDESDWAFALKLDVMPLTRKELEYRTKKLTRRINSRCQGLLEVSRDPRDMKPWLQRAKALGGFFFDVSKFRNSAENFDKSDDSEGKEGEEEEDEVKGSENKTKPQVNPGLQVDFLHRTVRDYLKTKEMHEILKQHTPKGFNPHSALCRAFLAQIKTLRPEQILMDKQQLPFSQERKTQLAVRSEVVLPIAHSIFRHAQSFEAETQTTDMEMLDELDRVKTMLLTSEPQGSYRHTRKPTSWVMTTALKYGMTVYLSQKLKYDSILSYPTDGLCTPLLLIALDSADTDDSERNLAMVRLLLEHGADPNAKCEGSTVWGAFMQRVCESWEIQANGSLRRHIHQLIMLLLQHGAIANQVVTNKSVFGLYLFTVCKDQGSDILNRARMEIIQAILGAGADPNGIYEQDTIWSSFVKMLSKLNHRGTGFEFTLALSMLDHGANKKLQVNHQLDMDRSLSEIFEAAFPGWHASRYFEQYDTTNDMRKKRNRSCCCSWFLLRETL